MVQIVIGQRGWVWIGRVEETEKEVVIRNASCVRRWGTTKGLGELRDGPKENTKLDPVGIVRLHPLSIVARHDVDAAKWEAALGGP